MKIPHLVVVIALAAIFVSAQTSPGANARSSGHSQAKRVKGTVKWFNDAKGIGYITGESGEEFYFDKVAANGHTIEGECVTFKIKSSPKGPTAKRVRRCPGTKPPTPGPMLFPLPPKP